MLLPEMMPTHEQADARMPSRLQVGRVCLRRHMALPQGLAPSLSCRLTTP